jgi:Uncharacterized conserved protein (DUF2285)
MSGAELRQASDGWHAVLRLEGVAHRLWLREIPAKGMPLVIELPLDADFELRSRAAHRFWSALEKRTLGKPPPTLPLQRRQRLTFAIRALDGRIEGTATARSPRSYLGKIAFPKGAVGRLMISALFASSKPDCP